MEELRRIAEADRQYHMPAYTGNAVAVKRLGCMFCNGPLKMYYLPAGQSLIGAAMGWKCLSCGKEWHSDGLRKQPPWVAELGQEITTEPEQKAANQASQPIAAKRGSG